MQCVEPGDNSRHRVKVEVKREPGIDEFEEDDHGGEEQGGRDGKDRARLLENHLEKRLLHAGCESRTGIKEKHAQVVGGFVQDEQGKDDEDELRLGVGELQSKIFRSRRGFLRPRVTGSSIEILKR